MQITSIQQNNDVVFKLTGSLDVACQDALKGEMSKIEKSANKRFIVDLSGVSFIDSACLGVFVSIVKNLKAKDKQLVFVAPQDEVRSIFQITRLDRLFLIVDNLDELTA